MGSNNPCYSIKWKRVSSHNIEYRKKGKEIKPNKESDNNKDDLSHYTFEFLKDYFWAM